MVVSREYVARQVQKVIAWRETWLQRQGLPLATIIRDGLADHFLERTRSMNSILLTSNRRSNKGMPTLFTNQSRAESIPGGVSTRKS